jgi:hypothetical protein
MKPSACSLTLLIAASILLGACNYPGERTTQVELVPPTEEGPGETYPVDPVFAEFYDYLGGEGVLGRALTPIILSGSQKSQYIEAGLMIYDPLEAGSNRHQLAPLGVEFGIAEPQVESPSDPEARYINGHVIFPEFVPFYERMGGAQFVGQPLTEARHNPEKYRIEQYFENLGFYRLDWDEPGTVRLIAYGAYACDERCRYQVPSASIPTRRGFLPEPFAANASRLGLNLLGRTLSEPRLAQDGQLEVIFENVVMVMETAEVEKIAPQPVQVSQVWLPLAIMDQAEAIPLAVLGIPDFYWLPLVSNDQLAQETVARVILRPIVALLGLPSSAPGERVAEALMEFVPVAGELGFNVPLYFMDWLERNGGLQVSGPPSGQVFPTPGGVYRQCFTTLCLDFDPRAAAGKQLHPAPLGVSYKERFFQEASGFAAGQSLDEVSLQVWEGKPFVRPGEEQVIHVALEEAGIPLAKREPVLTLTLPDNSQQQITMLPTDDRGQTSAEIGPISASGGTLIAYEVCLGQIDGEQLCRQDHFLIWED